MKIGVASLIFGAIGGGLHKARTGAVKRLITDPDADVEERLGAVQEVYQEIARKDKGLAERWRDGAALAVLQAMTMHLTSWLTRNSIASRVKHVYDIANRDVEAWLKAVMSPLETQVREHHMQLRRRLESIKRIHHATDTLEDRAIVVTLQSKPKAVAVARLRKRDSEDFTAFRRQAAR